MFRDVLLYQDFDIRAAPRQWASVDVLFPLQPEPPAPAQRPATQFYPPSLYLPVETDYRSFTEELAERIPRVLGALRDLLITAGASALVTELADDATHLNVNWGYRLDATNATNTFSVQLELVPAGTLNHQMTTILALQATANSTPLTTTYDPGPPVVYFDHQGHNQSLGKSVEFEQVVLGELLIQARETLGI